MVRIGRDIGPDHPPFLVAEIGINHNGSLADARAMIHLVKMSGAEAVKFQKRTPRIVVPESEWDKPRQTPWGLKSYIEYKEDIEFGKKEYDVIDKTCKEVGILWFASVWDLESLEFMEQYDPPCHKIGSASLTDYPLVQAVVDTGRPIIMSTGAATPNEMFKAVMHVSRAWERLILCHSTSIYPCPTNQLNFKMIETLKNHWPMITIGYSGHEIGGRTVSAAVALGASYIEKHFTLDRRGWGTDQKASIERWQFKDMAERCHETWASLGTGVKEVYSEELAKKATLVREDGSTSNKGKDTSTQEEKENAQG